MTGPGHYEEAEHLLGEPCEFGCPDPACPHEMRLIARAQVHATLALAAAQAMVRPGEMPVWDAVAWQDVAGTRPEGPVTS